MLHEFLRDIARRPFVWGECDCTLILADWWMLNHGVDPAIGWRGTYSTRGECHAMLAARGGLLRVVRDLAVSTAATRTAAPLAGDFGVVRHSGKHVSAICVGTNQWAGKSPDGVTVFRPDKIAMAWKI